MKSFGLTKQVNKAAKTITKKDLMDQKNPLAPDAVIGIRRGDIEIMRQEWITDSIKHSTISQVVAARTILGQLFPDYGIDVKCEGTTTIIMCAGHCFYLESQKFQFNPGNNPAGFTVAQH